MNGAYRVGLALVVNLAIVSGVVLPGVAGAIAPVVAQKQADEAQQVYDEGYRLFQKGDAESLRQAIGQFENALKLSHQSYNRPLQALSLLSLGLIYANLGQLQKALEFDNQALPIFRVVGDLNHQAMTLNNIGAVYSALGENTKALEFYNQALLLFRVVGDSPEERRRQRRGEAMTLNNIGAVYSALGENTKALEFYNQALPLRRKVGDRSGESATLDNIGQVYFTLGDHSNALKFYDQALSLRIFVGDHRGGAVTLSNIGRIYSASGDKLEALKFYNQALPIFRAVGDRGGEAATLNLIGSDYSDLGDKPKALEFYNQALPIFRAVGDRGGESATLSNIGRIYFELGDKIKALGFYNQALPLARTVGDRGGEASILWNLADLYRTQNKLSDALQNINAAIQIIESLRSEIKNDVLKTSYFTSVQGYYQFKTELLMQLHQQQPTKGYDAQALETTDQRRARVLRELLIQAKANIKKDISPDLLNQEQTLNQTLNAKETQLVQLTSQPDKATQIATLNQEIATLYTQRDDLKNTIRTTNPAYANLQYPKPVTLTQIQQQLDPDTLMLQYSLGEKESYLWVIGQSTLHTYTLPKRSDIETTAQSFRLNISDPETFQKLKTSATKLTQQILTPAAAQLGKKRLVIIPDGELHNIPFAALNTPNAIAYNPLLTTHEITNLPSASTIAILRTTVATKPRGPKTLAILADPIFTKDDPRLTSKTTQASNNLDLNEQRARDRASRSLANLSRLPFTATEAQGILKLTPNQDNTSAFGFDASYDWITDPKISQYRYIHLATHGFFDNDKPALSSIILSSFDAQGRDRKAHLRFPDLFNLTLPTELVVLSACQTGLGSNIPGEGLVGMTRGLMYAGALRVAVSLWSVDDQATSDLMQDFYQNLWQTKQSHAASLRQAQLKLWKQGKAPYYWAAFTLQGEWRN
jgi:CHAT domain-containing protein